MLSVPEHPNSEEAVRARLRDLAGLATQLREGLQTTHASLPVSPREDLMFLGELEADFATEARRTIECELADHLEPLIQALHRLAAYRPEVPE
jgi:hypothetical protein